MDLTTALIKFRHCMTGEELSTMRFPISTEVDVLRVKAVEAFAASQFSEDNACGSLSFVMGGRILPDKGMLQDFYTSTNCEDDHLVIDIVQRYELELQVGMLESGTDASHNRAYVSQADFAKLVPQGHNLLLDRFHVQVADKILSLEAREQCPTGQIHIGQLLRDFCGLALGEKLLVSQAMPSDVCELRHCSMQVMAFGGWFAAPREPLRVSREALRAALRECEGQILSMDQPLPLQPDGRAHV
eukprot:TRINITY_DN68507_c0_g1_i1.p1 TRINITY_DN68507_c0_g1~~TRINITY_DN68507_c0_g1_i1.p1  ORF type:complete len:256 (+),score=40.57 TRINITY_DN68507_c0_g1_i1:39-770(+)